MTAMRSRVAPHGLRGSFALGQRGLCVLFDTPNSLPTKANSWSPTRDPEGELNQDGPAGTQDPLYLLEYISSDPRPNLCENFKLIQILYHQQNDRAVPCVLVAFLSPGNSQPCYGLWCEQRRATDKSGAAVLRRDHRC